MIAPRQIRTKTSRTTQELVNTGTAGPFLAKVIGHLDQTFMGGLKVQLLRTTSSADNDSQDGEIVTVKYASPFFGSTPIYGAGGADNYSNTQKSYGFWAVPPDVGTKVLVTFVEGRRDFGFWFACVPDDFMNFSVPDPRVSTINTTPGTPEYLSGRKLPVGEYNKHLVDPQGQAQPTYYPRPVNEDYLTRMEEQGLDEDDIRGLTSSSARREVPSNVYGMSTPGPLDKRQDAPKVHRGTVDSEKLFFSSRLGGHSIVMDDGDEKVLRRGSPIDTPQEYVSVKEGETGGDSAFPANELFRLRTRTGHQILLHNTEDLIYISNSRGTSWIELSSNGKIDIFAQDSVSVHSSQDINFTADRDINFTARENMNVNIGKNYKNTIGGNYSLTAADFCSFLSGSSFTVQTDSYFALTANGSATIQAAAGELNLLSSSSAYLASNAELNISSNGNLNIGSKSDVNLTAKNLLVSTDLTNMTSQSTFISATASIHQNAGSAIFATAANSMNLKAGANMFTQAGTGFNILSSGSPIRITGSTVDINGTVASEATPADPASPASGPGFAQPGTPQTPFEAPPAARIPEHEPWLQHENLDPTQFVPERTRAGEQQTDVFSTTIPDTFVRVVAQPGATGATYRSPNYGDSDGEYGINPEDESSEYTDQGFGETATGPIGPLLELIKLAESNNNYNIMWGGVTLAPPKTLTTMTIQEVLNYQKLATSGAHPQKAKPTSSAAGAYQVIQDTLAGIYDNAGLTLSSVYSPKNQDAIGIALLEQAGLTRFRNGSISITDFANNIAKVWASFPVVTNITGSKGQQLKPGQSYYDGVGSNSATGKFQYTTVLAVLDQMRTVSRGTGADGIRDLPPGITGGGSGSNVGNSSEQSATNLAVNVPTGGLNPTSGQLRVFYDFTIEDYRTVSPDTLRARSQVNKARPMRIQDNLFQILNKAAHSAGIDEVRIYSGGQITAAEARALGATPVSGRGVTLAVGNQKVRTGSTRHDGGRAADIRLKKNGKILTANNANDRRAMTAFFVYAAQYGLHTAAHPYMDPREQQSFHVDCLSNLAPHYENTSRWLIQAMNEGKKRR
jgi:hypothetical protein